MNEVSQTNGANAALCVLSHPHQGPCSSIPAAEHDPSEGCCTDPEEAMPFARCTGGGDHEPHTWHAAFPPRRDYWCGGSPPQPRVAAPVVAVPEAGEEK